MDQVERATVEYLFAIHHLPDGRPQSIHVSSGQVGELLTFRLVLVGRHLV
jgi:hypothetical protein